MTYQETLTFLFEKLPMFQRIGKQAFKKDLTNTLKICEALDNPQKKFKSIHIAGTNGKGSTAHSISSVLISAGYKVGLYTSPHLKSFTERIKINGEECSEDFVVDFVEKHKDLIEKIKPSFFEITVVMAFEYFARRDIDIAVIEVGMGGRFDSTNVIHPILSLITSIGLDHQEFLGDTLDKIAFEKAGIIKEGVPVIISEKHPETEKVFKEKANSLNAPISFAQDSIQDLQRVDEEFEYIENEKKIRIPFSLKGNYQDRNIPLILRGINAIKELGFELRDEDIRSGLSDIQGITGLKGRWQIIKNKPLIICDTGHNQDAIQSLNSQIKSIQHDKLYMVMGFVNDKELDKIFDLLPKEAEYVFCEAKIPRAKKLEEVQELARRHNLKFNGVRDVNEAIGLAKEKMADNDLLFIGGSTFVVAEIENL